MKNKETLEEFAEREASEFYEKGTVDWNKFRQLIEVGGKWQQENMSIHILDVDNTKVSIQEGVVIVEKNDKTLISYNDKEVENILIEYVLTNPSKPYRVVSWFGKFKRNNR